VIREQLTNLALERDEARTQLDQAKAMHEEVIKDLADSERYAESLAAHVVNLRKQADDLRQQVNDLRIQRDSADKSAERMMDRLRSAEIDLARAMGWVDGKMGGGPALSSTKVMFP
jgi:predicted  nucleic acid-binding Zn-ribbon protein